MRRLLVLGTLVGTVFAAGCGSTAPSPIPTRPSPSFSQPTRQPSAADLSSALDRQRVLERLNERTTLALEPTPAEARQAGIAREAFLARVPAIVEASYPGEGAEPVSVHLVIVDVHNPRITIDHRLSYVVETTGHATGNCFTLYDADTAVPFIASCFHEPRRSPS